MATRVNPFIGLLQAGLIGRPLSLSPVLFGYPERQAFELLTEQALGARIYGLFWTNSADAQLVEITAPAEFRVFWTETVLSTGATTIFYSLFGLTPREADVLSSYSLARLLTERVNMPAFLARYFLRKIAFHVALRVARPFIDPYQRDVHKLILGVALMIVGFAAGIYGGVFLTPLLALPGLAVEIIGFTLCVFAVTSTIRHLKGTYHQGVGAWHTHGPRLLRLVRSPRGSGYAD